MFASSPTWETYKDLYAKAYPPFGTQPSKKDVEALGRAINDWDPQGATLDPDDPEFGRNLAHLLRNGAKRLQKLTRTSRGRQPRPNWDREYADAKAWVDLAHALLIAFTARRWDPAWTKASLFPTLTWYLEILESTAKHNNDHKAEAAELTQQVRAQMAKIEG